MSESSNFKTTSKNVKIRVLSVYNTDSLEVCYPEKQNQRVWRRVINCRV